MFRFCWCNTWKDGEFTRGFGDCPKLLGFGFWKNPGPLAVTPVLKPEHPREPGNNNSLGQFLAWFQFLSM